MHRLARGSCSARTGVGFHFDMGPTILTALGVRPDFAEAGRHGARGTGLRPRPVALPFPDGTTVDLLAGYA